jgi:hypothetical protein
MRLKMVRDIPINRLTENLRSTFEDNLPKIDEQADQKKKDELANLKLQIDDFLGRFKNDLKSGAYVEINYIPGKGTAVKENGKPLGAPVPGKAFGDLVWRSYFGSKTCCSALKSSIVEACKKR